MKVTERALEQRIRRVLSTEMKSLHKTRDVGNMKLDFGDYYVVDNRHNCIADKHVDLEDLGREIGVLSGAEEVTS